MRRLGLRPPLRLPLPHFTLKASWRGISGGEWETCGVGASERLTYYDYLDSFWNRRWFGATESLTSSPESSPFAELFVFCQEAAGLEPAVAIFFLGALTRFLTLFFSLYGERASERMQNAMRRLKAPHEAFQRVYYREGSAAIDIQLAATALKGERRRVFLEEKTSNMRCLSSLLGSPVVLFGVFQTSAICENPRFDVGTSSFLWCPALTMPDPYCILPLMFCALTLLNFELSLCKNIKTKWVLNLLWGARIACVCVLPAAVQVRAGVALFFIGMNAVGLLQPLLLRSTAFRTWFDFPSRHSAENGKAAVRADDSDEISARMCVQFPYLSHLLNPESEETDLMKKAKTTTSTFSYGSGGSASGYAKDNRPVRQEEKEPRLAGGVLFSSSSAVKAKAGSELSGKGLSFARSGWKTPQTVFSEEDFIPDVAAFDSASKNKKK